MIHEIQAVTAKEDYVLEVLFASGETKEYDMKPVLDRFPGLKENPELFSQAKVDRSSRRVCWGEDMKIEHKVLWSEGVLLEVPKKPTVNHLLAYQMLLARERSGLTQSELAQKTGIYQADISKIERGLGNPSLLTINRLVQGLDMALKIEIVEK